MKKRAQGLSINVIVIVAIALIVLVVLIAIFTGRLGGFVKGVGATTSCSNSCQALDKTGTVVDIGDCVPSGRPLPASYDNVDPDTQECCCTEESTV